MAKETHEPKHERMRGQKYIPGCTCGWAGVKRRNKRAADRVWARHYKEADDRKEVK